MGMAGLKDSYCFSLSPKINITGNLAHNHLSNGAYKQTYRQTNTTENKKSFAKEVTIPTSCNKDKGDEKKT